MSQQRGGVTRRDALKIAASAAAASVVAGSVRAENASRRRTGPGRARPHLVGPDEARRRRRRRDRRPLLRVRAHEAGPRRHRARGGRPHGRPRAHVPRPVRRRPVRGRRRRALHEAGLRDLPRLREGARPHRPAVPAAAERRTLRRRPAAHRGAAGRPEGPRLARLQAARDRLPRSRAVVEAAGPLLRAVRRRVPRRVPAVRRRPRRPRRADARRAAREGRLVGGGDPALRQRPRLRAARPLARGHPQDPRRAALPDRGVPDRGREPEHHARADASARRPRPPRLPGHGNRARRLGGARDVPRGRARAHDRGRLARVGDVAVGARADPREARVARGATGASSRASRTTRPRGRSSSRARDSGRRTA